MPNQHFAAVFARVTLHYAIIIGGAFLAIRLIPGVEEFLPVGAMKNLFSVYGSEEIEVSMHAGRLAGQSDLARGFFILMCFLTSIIVSIPVGRTYMATHLIKKRNASVAKALLLLPVAVSGLVLIVQNNLALAFSLAGIVAGCGIRFRSNIKEFTDTLYFMVAIGIGLAAGVGALGIAVIMSMVFCYATLAVFATGYGEHPDMALEEDGSEPEAVEPGKQS